MMRTRYANLISKTEVQCIADLSKDEKLKKHKDKSRRNSAKSQHKSNR